MASDIQAIKFTIDTTEIEKALRAVCRQMEKEDREGDKRLAHRINRLKRQGLIE